jgi:putative flippase GtrA
MYKNFQVDQFILIGFINTIFGYSASIFMLYLVQTPWISLAIANTLSVLFSYLTNSKLLFAVPISIKTFFLFISYYLIILIAQVNLLEILYQYTNNSFISFTIIFPFVVLITFIVYRKIIFKNNL